MRYARWTPGVLYILLVLLGCLAARAALAVAPPYDGRPGVTAGQECVNPKDGAVMVWVPAGLFLMGSLETDPDASEDEMPQRAVTLDGYWIYKHQITSGQFSAFCAATQYVRPRKPHWYRETDRQPVLCISWSDAAAYARWAGTSLPTEAQWEKAARGTDGRTYPWGNTWDLANCLPCYDATRDRLIWWVNGPPDVGSVPAGASPYGCLDMVGTLWEYCQDRYDPNYYALAPSRNPPGSATGAQHVIRGGCGLMLYGVSRQFRGATRNANSFGQYVGFRCVVRPERP